MKSGFFAKSDLITQSTKVSLIPQCGACGLFKGCKNPKMQPAGKCKKKILLIGTQPGEEDDARKLHFVGNSGRYLRERLRHVGIDVERDCLSTYAAICRGKGTGATDKQIHCCTPNLRNLLRDNQFNAIVPLGDDALTALLPIIYKKGGKKSVWNGWQIPLQKLNTWVCPTFNPALVQSAKEKNNAFEVMFDVQLRKIAAITDRPYKRVPDYSRSVEIILNDRKAEKIIRRFTERGGWHSVDYETNRVNPNGESPRALCCSICHRGERTIAFPWTKRVAKAMREFYLSRSVFKIAQNLKFEHRWTLMLLGIDIRSWGWDTMVNMHILDNRPGITGLEFSSFVNLGFNPHSGQIDPFLGKDGGSGVNKWRDINWKSLLLYCGLDSLLEYEIARIQMKTFGIPMSHKELWCG